MKNYKKLEDVIAELDALGYDYIDGFVNSVIDRIISIHRLCGRERTATYCTYDVKGCRHCSRAASTAGNKFIKVISEQDGLKILELNKNNKTNTEISREMGFSTTAIRLFLKKNSLESYIKGTEIVTKNCKYCGNKFTVKLVSKNPNRHNYCSSECGHKAGALAKNPYTKDEIDKVIDLKKQNKTIQEIEDTTKVNRNKIKKVTKQNELFLTKEQGQANAYAKKLEIDPKCMEHMRDFHMVYPTPIYNKKIDKIQEVLQSPDNQYAIPYLSNKENVNGNSVRMSLHSRGLSDLIGQFNPSSSAEKEIIDFIKIIAPNKQIINRNRTIIKPKEIDIYLPSLSLGIEYCGTYWHSEACGKESNYHHNKMVECNKQEIRLITIFEDEWLYRQPQVKSFLKSVIGKYETKIYARKCELKEVEKETAKEFLDSYHIQGKTTLETAFGLYYKDELVGLVTGNKHHRQDVSGNPFVLNRLVFKDGYLVVGGSSRLNKALVNYAKTHGYQQLISWSDNRWSEGNVYKKCGFTLEEELKPDYSYVTPKATRESKQSNKKINLIEKGAPGTMENTELELAQMLGYSKIWDCGKKRWVIKF